MISPSGRNIAGAVVGGTGLERELHDVAISDGRIFRPDLLVDRNECFAALDILKQPAQLCLVRFE